MGAVGEAVADWVGDVVEGFSRSGCVRDSGEEHVGEVLAILGEEAVPIAVKRIPDVVDYGWS